MKKDFAKILSVVLAVSCLFSIIGCISNLSDVMKAKKYWENTSKEKHALLDTMLDGIDLLSENYQTYLDGVKALEEGQQKLVDGEQELIEGQAQYDEGAQLLADAHAEYDAGVDQYLVGKNTLEAAKREYEENLAVYNSKLQAYQEGKKLLESKRAEYEAGKQRLTEVTPIYNLCKPLYDDLQNTEAQIADAEARGDTLTASALRATLPQKQLTLSISLAGYTIPSIVQEYEDGLKQIAEFEAGEAKLAEAERQLAEGKAKLDAAAAKISEGEKNVLAGEQKLSSSKDLLDEKDKELENAGNTIQEGKESLENGKIELKEGEAQLAVYEDGQLELAAGLDQSIESETYYTSDGDAIVKSIADRLGSKFTYWKQNGRGESMIVHDARLLDLDKARLVHKTSLEFMDDMQEAVSEELKGRIISIILIALAAIAGLIGAVSGFMDKYTPATIFGFISASASIIALGIVMTTGSDYPLSEVAGSSVLVSALISAVFLTIFSLGHTVAAFLVKSSEERDSASTEYEART